MSAGTRVRFATAAFLVFFSGVVSTWAVAADAQLCDVNADFSLGSEDYATTIRLHRRLLQSEPDNALAHYHLGFAYGMLGQFSQELAEYETSARLGLKNWDLFLNLGLAYFAQQNLVRASAALEKSVSLGPQHAEPHFNLAIVYEAESRMGEALRKITAAQHLAPADPDIANENAIICVETGEFVHAREIWEHLIQLAPDYQSARANLAILNGSIARNCQIDGRTMISYSQTEGSVGHAACNRDLRNLQTAAQIGQRIQ